MRPIVPSSKDPDIEELLTRADEAIRRAHDCFDQFQFAKKALQQEKKCFDRRRREFQKQYAVKARSMKQRLRTKPSGKNKAA
jgi:DNA repair photolyase